MELLLVSYPTYDKISGNTSRKSSRTYIIEKQTNLENLSNIVTPNRHQ